MHLLFAVDLPSEVLSSGTSASVVLPLPVVFSPASAAVVALSGVVVKFCSWRLLSRKSRRSSVTLALELLDVVRYASSSRAPKKLFTSKGVLSGIGSQRPRKRVVLPAKC